MDRQTPETRPPAPGRLRVVQEFMNSGNLGWLGVPPVVAEEIRARRAAGEPQASVASDYGVPQGLVSALARGVRLEDELANVESAREWLAERDLLPGGGELDEAELERLRELRELLRALGEANNGQRLSEDVVAALNRVAAESPLAVQFGSWDEPALEPLRNGAAGRILAIVYDAMRDGTFARLKRCPGDGCPHTFYDGSRNRTGTWCSMSVCGNRTKVRSYQSRRRSAKVGDARV